MDFLIALVGFALLASAHATPVHMDSEFRPSPNVDSVWLLDQNYTGYVYSPLKSRLLALSPGGLAVDELDLLTKTVAKTYTLPIPGYRIGIGRSGRLASVVHNSYITFIDVVEETIQTENFPYADVPVNGLVVDLTAEHETCGWIHLYQSGTYISEIVCVNPTNGNATKCYDQGGSYGYTSTTLGSPDGTYIYGLTSTGYIVKYYVAAVTPSPIQPPRCPSYRYAVKPNWGAYYTPTAAWFSYDDSRIFLNNGLTLSASSDQTEDIHEHGSFNSSFSQQNLYWIDQDAHFAGSHDVAAIRRAYDYTKSTYTTVINRYSWPFLKAESATIEIPVPATPAGMKMSSYPTGSQVYYYGATGAQLVAVVNYTLDNNLYAPGVAYITL